MDILSILLATTLQFSSPVNDNITLAGNFGEPRPHHFHGGIDVRTGMAVGKPIFAIADGYVSRVTVGLFGYGNALYITHPDGHSSVYCHLNGFAPAIRTKLSYYRKKHGQPDELAEWRKSPQVPADVYFKPYEIPVSGGQLVAISGNTGSSVAPHLHLEVHDTKGWAMRDPLTFVGKYLADTTPPQAHSFMAYPQPGEGVFNGASHQQYFGFVSHDLERDFYAWGKVGFGIWANDYMEGTFHHYGIYHTELTIDGNTIFESTVDSIPASMNRQVNSWGDYLHWRHQNVWYMKSFVEPGCQLPLFKVGADRGIFDFNEEKLYAVEYKLTDAFGNQSVYTFHVEGRRQPIPSAAETNTKWKLKWDRVNSIQLPGIQITLGKNLLGSDVVLQPRVVRQPDALSDAYCFATESMPIFDWAEIRIRLNRQITVTNRICVLGGIHEYPATIKDGWAIAKIRDLGETYMVGYPAE